MSSILTNNGAMVALQTLKSVNNDLSKTQSMISTGKDVASAKDNASVWAISKVMESDVKGFKGISDALSRGDSTVAVARSGAETITDLLTEVKGKIVAAQEGNADEREKIQADITALTDQISSVVSAAQFNGVNLLQGSEDIDVLSSLDRSEDGTVKTNSIAVSRQDLSTSAGEFGTTALSAAGYGTSSTANTTAAAGTNATITATGVAIGETFSLTVDGTEIAYTATSASADDVMNFFTDAVNALGNENISATADGTGAFTISNTDGFEGVELALDSTVDGDFDVTAVNGAAIAAPNTVNAATIDQRAATMDFSQTAGVNAGDSFRISVGGTDSFEYVAGANESMEDVARGLKTALDSSDLAGITAEVQQDETTGAWSLAVDDDTGGRALTLAVASGGEQSGGLFGLDALDVTSVDDAEAALGNIETMIANSIDASAAFGSAQGRIETQSDFISTLSDSLTSGIGSLVDADMEEASAKLQALQVQQQLGIQSLSIANQAPQSILSLFG